MFKLVQRPDGDRTTTEEGQGLAEYGLVLSFIALVSVTALSTIGGSVAQMLSALSGYAVIR